MTGIRERCGDLVKILSSCIPHLSHVVRKGRYVIKLKPIGCSVYMVFVLCLYLELLVIFRFIRFGIKCTVCSKSLQCLV